MLSRCHAYLAKIGLLAKSVEISAKTITEPQRPPSTTIEDLPNELLDEIGGYLIDSKIDVHALCLSTKTLNVAATPIL